MDVFEELKKIMWKVTGIDPSAVKLESLYRIDLGLDSADLIELETGERPAWAAKPVTSETAGEPDTTD